MIILAASMEERVPSQVSSIIIIIATRLTTISLSGQLPDGSQLFIIPNGLAFETQTKCILGNGVVVDPDLLLSDFSNLQANGIDYKSRMLVSQRSHLITAFH